MSGPLDPRPDTREEDLDAGLELMLLAEASLWAAVDQGLEAQGLALGRSHWRAAFLIRRRPGLGVRDLAHLTSLSKQAASRILVDLAAKGLVEKKAGDTDGRRRSAALTTRGEAFEAAISERLRAQLSGAYRKAGLDGTAGARAILTAMAEGRAPGSAANGGRP